MKRLSAVFLALGIAGLSFISCNLDKAPKASLDDYWDISVDICDCLISKDRGLSVENEGSRGGTIYIFGEMVDYGYNFTFNNSSNNAGFVIMISKMEYAEREILLNRLVKRNDITPCKFDVPHGVSCYQSAYRPKNQINTSIGAILVYSGETTAYYMGGGTSTIEYETKLIKNLMDCVDK